MGRSGSSRALRHDGAGPLRRRRRRPAGRGATARARTGAGAMTVTIWHNPKCSTPRKVLDAIRARGVEPKIVLYAETPPSERDIKTVLKDAGISARDLLRRKGS